VRLVVVAGSTATARIEGNSAAGAGPELMVHTPAADLELLAYGRSVGAPAVPVSPTGTPTRR
jgi:NaMN:DMB phosphoribosyltransferase